MKYNRNVLEEMHNKLLFVHKHASMSSSSSCMRKAATVANASGAYTIVTVYFCHLVCQDIMR